MTAPTIAKRKSPRKNPLGVPPTVEKSRGNLMEPEAAPSLEPVTAEKKSATSKEGRAAQPKKARTVAKRAAAPAADGRTLRKTGRTEQFSTRVHPDFKQELFDVAQTTGKNYNVILEESLELYKKHVLSA